MTNGLYMYDDYNSTDDGFAVYQANTTDPGWPLMAGTLGYCAFVYFVAWVWIMKKRRVDRANASTSMSTVSNSSGGSSSSSERIRNANPTKKDIQDVESLSAVVALDNSGSETSSQEKRSTKKKRLTEGDTRRKAKRKGSTKQQRRKKASAFDDESVLTFSSFFGGGQGSAKRGKSPSNLAIHSSEESEGRQDGIAKRKAAYGRSDSDYQPMEEIEDVEDMMFLDEPMKEIHRLSGPW